MAKCPICNSKKGKRKCLIVDELICSLCCGSTRKEEACSGCRFYQKPRRKYNEVPAYSVSEMDGNIELENYGNAVEGALCEFDIAVGNTLNDSGAIRIIEILMDIHHFGEQEIDTDSPFIANGVDYVEHAIREDLADVSNEVIVKILGVIRFVARRRTNAGREYMKIIHRYVGRRVTTGVRVLQQGQHGEL